MFSVKQTIVKVNSNPNVKVNRMFKVYLLAMIGTILIVGPTLQEDLEKIDHHNYCTMVKKYKVSGGEMGWPDYKEIYNKKCFK